VGSRKGAQAQLQYQPEAGRAFSPNLPPHTKESEAEKEQWFPGEVLFLTALGRRTISGSVCAVMPVKLGLAKLFQTKLQGPIYRLM
jgi:hypothetical protein